MTTASKPATIYDVARAAGVSHQSVSRVLRGVQNVGPDVRERVEIALRDLDYRPSSVARELAYGRRNRIGAVGFEAFESSTGRVLRGVDEVVRREGYVLDIVTVDPLGDVEDIAQQLDAINGMDVAGLLATTPTTAIRRALERSSFGMPVHVDEQLASPSGGDAAARMALQLLFDLGHERIAHIAGPLAWDSAAHRAAAYTAAMTERGFRPLPVPQGDWSARSGYEAAAAVPWDDVTAVLVGNDRMALGVLRALEERGLRVPEEVSVVGIDDIPEAAFFSPPLTTVRIDFVGTGRIAAESLLASIRGSDRPGVGPGPDLVVRASSAAARR